MQLPASVTRVARHTAPHINNRIKAETARRARYYSDHPDQIPRRLRELDREWDIEQALEANASIVALTGLIIGLRRRGFMLLPLMVMAFLLQHALQGWCPPISIFRRLGFRTRYEIEVERYTLKILRGDFDGVDKTSGVERTLQAVDVDAPKRNEEPPAIH